MRTGNQKLKKLWGLLHIFYIPNSQKQNKMLIEESTLNTKDQGTVKINFGEKRMSRRNAKQRHILLCHF